jgi:hypothetical protein
MQDNFFEKRKKYIVLGKEKYLVLRKNLKKGLKLSLVN